ncbi:MULTISPECIES: 50S ribosomal protein L21e [Methanococcoides]|jgi:large subunit ribosomal protein L21e|uniref:Large ribosomal subunit protein eL21 n=2 Tax=Methanococcoides TaxID=2225 RepID=RL21_METBU|nr:MULTISPECIES: 50S ribosomal protein L21e [Methanococcoides]Q12XH4.1 RecName: Full=Large ribosomal subunit protein eL21; AltName: Full=50S ribosomal protein L21e [Methanococcoides burtonii DSM 6242]NPE27286.1 50S ribosomal protein L21e [Methanococcoides sp. SA1]ABE51852.1 LSU ribosomal protein L21E [Methanococcoides burtonii DSM 6242]MDA0524465.1 50S ribosomal protein L21e [Methanococcoides alaskense]MDR6223284.1 large subunit ribosomal protein L21e [Methanococcoides alaskense]NPE30125.1 50
MPTSHGERSCTRYKLKKTVRERGLSPISKAIQDFEEGQMVHIDIDPSVQKGMPNAKFQGKTGKVLGKRGRAYLLQVTDGNSKKEVISLSQHLKPQKY